MVCAGNGMFKKWMFEFCSRLTSSMLADFLLPDQEGDEYKEDKKPFARFSFQTAPFSCEQKPIQTLSLNFCSGEPGTCYPLNND